MTKIINRPDLKLKPLNSLDVAHTFSVVFHKERLTGIYTPYKKWTRDGRCSCVFACPQFKTYPMDKWGMRAIPFAAQCPYIAGPCHGAHWYVRNTGGYVKHVDTVRGRRVATEPLMQYVLGRAEKLR